MNKSHVVTALALSATLGLLTGCNDDDDDNDIVTSNPPNFQQFIKALGGEDTVLAREQINYSVVGTAYEFQEQPEPVEEQVASYSINLNATMDGNKLRQEWNLDIDYAFNFDLNFTEVMMDGEGAVLPSEDVNNPDFNSFGAAFFGGFGVPNDPMNVAKQAGRVKTWFMSSPLAIAQQMLIQGDDNDLVTEFNGHQVTLILDEQTNLPVSAETLELDPLYGDVIYKVEYLDWQLVDGAMYPHRRRHHIDGNLIREETLSNISFGDTGTDPFDFAGETPVAIDAIEDETALAKGYLSSQFYRRAQTIGFPFDNTDESLTDRGMDVTGFIDNDQKVLRVMGTDHYNYAFNIGGSVYIYDASFNNERQQAVLAEIQNRFPNLPIGGVIMSHNHFDHAGGFRGALSQGGNLIVGDGSQTLYEDLLTRPHTLQDNPLEQRDEIAMVIPVNGELILGEGDDTLHIFSLPAGHAEAEDMLVLYRPVDQTLYFADLYNAGFAGLLGAPNLAPTLQDRAQQLVDFVENKGLAVTTIAPTHGSVLFDSLYTSVEMTANPAP